jgi:DhnA family fructose-bisphosphate aldolase class Ia
MNGIDHRLQTFIHPTDRRCLMVDTSAGLSLGTLPGLENFPAAVRPILSHADGVVCSPGQIGKLSNLKKDDAALLVRMDWNNTLRGSDFVLPAASARRIPLLTPQEALDLGASGMVNTFLLGYDEEVEAACLYSTVQFALEGKTIGLPLLVEIQATGSGVSIPGKAVELGASYALEGGADVIVVPYPGYDSLKTIAAFASVPWLIHPTNLKEASVELEQALGMGAAGVWLDYTIFREADPRVVLDELGRLVHSGIALAR